MRIWWRIIAAVVLLAAIAGLGWFAYQAGVTNGLAQQVTTQGNAPQAVPYPYHWHPFFGFGLLGCLIPLFLLFLVFGSIRALLWHGHWGMRRHWHRGPWGWRDGEDRGYPPFFEEWHKRAHGEKSAEPEQKDS